MIINPEIIPNGTDHARRVGGLPEHPGHSRHGPAVHRHHRVRPRSRRQEIELQLKDFPARVAQHETDHLDGVLFFDRMTSMQSLTYLDEYSRYPRQGRRRLNASIIRSPCSPRRSHRHTPNRTDDAVRRRHCGRAHLLFAARHRHGRGHRQAARLDRRADVRRRPSHRLPARALRVRAREHLAAVRLDVPAFVPVLQLGAVEPALRQAEGAARVRAADQPARRATSTSARSSAPGIATRSSRRCSRTMRSRS